VAPIAARHLRMVVDHAARVIALELLCACRALEFRRPLTAGRGSERLYGAVRRIAPAPEGDRPLTGPCEEVARWVLSAAPVRLADPIAEVLVHAVGTHPDRTDQHAIGGSRDREGVLAARGAGLCMAIDPRFRHAIEIRVRDEVHQLPRHIPLADQRLHIAGIRQREPAQHDRTRSNAIR